MSTNKEWNLVASELAKKSENSIRSIWEDSKNGPNPLLKVITLQIGDPTVFGNFKVAPETREALRNALETDTFSYMSCEGPESSREPVAQYVNTNNDKVSSSLDVPRVTSKDIILTSGCSMALEMCFRVFALPGENILLPRPCWGYSTWILGYGIEARYFDLDPMKEWQVDIKHLESMINDKTKAILINNPGNPCGNVYSKEHLLEILEVAERHKLPIISDEVYEFFTFPGVQFYPLATLSKTVPILTCSGLTKRFIMPAARMGWIVINDRNNVLSDIKEGLLNIAGRNFIPNSTLVKALPGILENTPQQFFDDNSKTVSIHALSVFNILKTCPGIVPIMPKGAMYLMAKIELDKFPEIDTCLAFTQRLFHEQSVGVFPGFPCFNFPGFFRIVLTVPEDLIIEACERIKTFCEKYYKADGQSLEA
ncbi:tyrosine aminotransferase-like isoform X2 [Chironomus tepperi]|uniref:tyrosine aminotransferase-like isoform X2 n=1 Tax=Chironomus tepperi TaxID=113505 RepID=UPI00391F4A49